MSPDAPRFMWGHVNLNVRDLERAIAFYAQLGFRPFRDEIPYLGLERESERLLPDSACAVLGLEPGARGRGCILELDGGFPKLDLTALVEESLDAPPRAPLATRDLGLVRLCLATTDLDREYARLSAEGIAFGSPPRTDERRLAKVALCLDPDGNQIELIEIDLARWAALDE